MASVELLKSYTFLVPTPKVYGLWRFYCYNAIAVHYLRYFYLDFDNLTESDQNMFWRHHDEVKIEKVKNAQYFNTDDITKVYELQNEVSELKKKFEEREIEAAEAKTKSDEIIDYLHGEKVRLESELETTKEELNLLNRERYSPAQNVPPTSP